MKAGLTISTAIHAGLLLWGLVSFSARPLEAAQTDSLPIDIVTDKEFSKLAAGVKTAPKAEAPKPLVEKVAEPKPVDEPVPKISEKPEIKTASEPPPQAEAKPAEAKPEKQAPPPVDAIAEALKKEEAKKKREEARAKAAELKKQKEAQQPKFDPKQISALLDKRDPQRQASAGETLSQSPALGTRTGTGPKLSQSELEALRARLMQLWNPPAGVQNPQELIVKVRVQLARDGRLIGNPVVLSAGNSTLFTIARDNAIRALHRGQPFDMLSPGSYELWKEIEITFDPRDMYRG
jgi:outer membrane biosynthesis protein TonB